ncbi:MAG TPA: hypothetical protein VHQ00_16610, partial [Chloroflexota bacterium]|nr:hypothetical protein [Chloroflexota bacterium]
MSQVIDSSGAATAATAATAAAAAAAAAEAEGTAFHPAGGLPAAAPAAGLPSPGARYGSGGMVVSISPEAAAAGLA